ncbi:hypothetical protein Tco_1108521 [Tanacetum coccineum]
MLLTRLFTHVMSSFLELSNDCYILCDRVMHPLAPHYERKTRSDHGTKRCRSSNLSSSYNVLDRPSSSHYIDENNDEIDEESFHSNTPLPSQLINSLSNVIPSVFENLPHENQTIHTKRIFKKRIIKKAKSNKSKHGVERAKSKVKPSEDINLEYICLEKKILEEDVEKIIEGEDEESYASEFANSIFLDEEYSRTRIEPGSHKENPETFDDDEDDVDKKKDDKKDDDDDDDNDDRDDHALIITRVTELTATVSPTPATTSQDQSNSKPTSSKTKVFLGSIAQMSRRRGQLRKHMKHTFVTNTYFQEKMKEMSDTLNNLVPELIVAKTNDLIKVAVPRMVNYAVKKDREISTSNVPELISREFVMKLNLQDQVDDPELWDVLKHKFEKYSASFDPCRTDAFRKQDHDDRQEDDAPPKEEKRAKRQKTSKGLKFASKWDAWVEDTVIDEDGVIPENETLDLIEEFHNVDKHVLTIFDHEIIKATLRDMMSNQFKDAEEYAYHLEKSKNYYRNSEERKYVLSLHKIHAIQFPEEDLEEKMNRWADFKYLNKNNIEDMYYLFLNKKVNYRENKLLNSLMTFIRSRVIWERVHDFQLGIESYQKEFCKEVKLKIFETEFLKKAPLLGELDLEIMKAYDREITKRLRRRVYMRRWESFANG